MFTTQNGPIALPGFRSNIPGVEKFIVSRPTSRSYGFESSYRSNDFDALIPEIWAMESLRVMWPNMVAAGMVYRSFEDEIANYGDVVNTRKPSSFVAMRKTPGNALQTQDAVATNIAVPLDQHAYVSFVLDDANMSKSVIDIIELFAAPAIMTLVSQVDKTILGQYPRFLANIYGALGGMTTSNAPDYLIGMRQKCSDLLMPDDLQRNLILGTSAEAKCLGAGIFNKANESSDGGMTQRTGHMGQKFGFNIFACQNMATFTNAIPTSAGAVNNSGGYAAGTTALVVDGITGEIGANTWLTIAGDTTPQRVVSHTETTGNTTGLVLYPGLNAAVADNAVITFITPGAVNLSGGYAAGFVASSTGAGIKYDTTSSNLPKVGQFVTFGTSASNSPTVNPVYTIVRVNGDEIHLDRPLIVGIANDDKINFGPGGGYNLAFHKNAIAFVNRPLAQPMSGTGVRTAVRSYQDVALRASISYDASLQEHRVTLDMLYGVQVMDTSLGGVLLS